MSHLLSRFVFAYVLLVLPFCSAVSGQTYKVGYPDKTGKTDLESNFTNPPKGYGEVPFYWWMGDTLTRDHLVWQLDMLADKHISSLQVNYAHDDKGGVLYGKTLPSRPALFTEEWWELFGWFAQEASKRNMTVSLSDYTLGPGQGSYVDDMLAEDPSIHGYILNYKCDTIHSRSIRRTFENLPLSLNVYELDQEGQPTGRMKNLLPLVKNGLLAWNSKWPDMLVTEINPELKVPSFDPMNPKTGKSYVKHFFQRFEDRFPDGAKECLNFFFSDELQFNLFGFLWNDDFRKEFQLRKGYDIVPCLDALFMDIGDHTPRIRIDYNDVVVSLSQENYFIPIYEWHAERGFLYGCDHGGRGRDVTEFGDYFRTQRWNQAPGCDQPYLQTDIFKNKVATSMAHLYERERVWLEGFHSSGWSTNTEQLTSAIFSNMAMGHNILSLHGLYYSTMGGWWEWAPPCNHFHEPYWVEMEPLLACTERISYILSQGHHCADVAVIYPVAPAVAGYGNKAVQTADDAGKLIYRNGIDWDFIDFESLARAEVNDGALNVAQESYRVLVIPSMQAMRRSSLEKILEFSRGGGLVINVGDLPEATDYGRNDRVAEKMLTRIFDSGRSNVHVITDMAEVIGLIDKHLTRDFRILSDNGSDRIPYVMHNHASGKEVYAVYNVAKGSECFFRAKGAVHIWDPWTGNIKLLPIERTTAEGSVIRLPLEYSDMHIITFTPDTQPLTRVSNITKYVSEQMALDGEWGFKIVPLLDNRYGDFSLPAYDDKVGAMVYNARYSDESKHIQDQTFTYGTKFLIIGAAPELDIETLQSSLQNGASAIEAEGDKYVWRPYEFSWRWGVENDYGRQGWHGLKAHMYDDFIRLGRTEFTWNSNEILRVREENNMKNYYLFTRVVAPCNGVYVAEYGSIHPAALYVNGKRTKISSEVELEEGVNEILLHYDSYGVTRFVLRNGDPDIIEETLAEAPLRMKFSGDKSLLLFDVRSYADTKGIFTFNSAPGLTDLIFASYGAAEVRVGGIAAQMHITERREDGLIHYTAKLPEPVRMSTQVDIEVTEPWGRSGGAVIDGPIRQVCGQGGIYIGDWSEIEGLKAYSGGAVYTNTINYSELPEGRVILDLGKVISTARVYVNGHDVGLRLSPPWEFDITDCLKEGRNQIEIFVSNTAANYYLSVPTRFRGSVESGIIGPVVVRYTENKHLGE